MIAGSQLAPDFRPAEIDSQNRAYKTMKYCKPGNVSSRLQEKLVTKNVSPPLNRRMNQMAYLGSLDHIDIVVENPQKMANFFVSIGFKLVRKLDHGGDAVELAFPGEGDQPILELTSRDQGDGRVRDLGLRHIAVRSSDINKTFEELTARGFTFDKPPRPIEATGRMLTNLKDPEGRSLQIVDFPAKRD
jgi:catechol 2,3-dioxygenase-like lactoylglutathione lyase family enzyme